ncbi:unnamed protein product [Cuscuta campestris]|uniref:Uncharacterized protein n=1 Tax=Cuscuta campestris TaxID=132261 RepID=A0A484M3J6_9ASTE|nr:unnamed protein product [Cuscuta campestris]
MPMLLSLPMRVSICKAAGGGDGFPAAVEQGNMRFGAEPRDLTAAIWFEVGRRQALELHFNGSLLDDDFFDFLFCFFGDFSQRENFDTKRVSDRKNFERLQAPNGKLRAFPDSREERTRLREFLIID